MCFLLIYRYVSTIACVFWAKCGVSVVEMLNRLRNVNRIICLKTKLMMDECYNKKLA